MPVPFTLRRRALLSAVAVAAAATLPGVTSGQPARKLEPTPPDAEGPFYPTRLPADADQDLARIKGRPRDARGTLLYLDGRVLDVNGTALPGAKVELWQCDALGRYHHVDGDPGPRDEDFQGYGVATSDADGRFAFRTIRPVRYGGRPPHLHFRVTHGEAQPLTTQLYPRGESAERGGGFGLSPASARAKLEFVATPAAGREPDAQAARYDFVLRRA